MSVRDLVSERPLDVLFSIFSFLGWTYRVASLAIVVGGSSSWLAPTVTSISYASPLKSGTDRGSFLFCCVSFSATSPKRLKCEELLSLLWCDLLFIVSSLWKHIYGPLLKLFDLFLVSGGWVTSFVIWRSGCYAFKMAAIIIRSRIFFTWSVLSLSSIFWSTFLIGVGANFVLIFSLKNLTKAYHAFLTKYQATRHSMSATVIAAIQTQTFQVLQTWSFSGCCCCAPTSVMLTETTIM
jgi:hypothetical protein